MEGVDQPQILAKNEMNFLIVNNYAFYNWLFSLLKNLSGSNLMNS